MIHCGCVLVCCELNCRYNVQVLRVLPYSAAQLCGYDLFKKAFTPVDGELTVKNKLAAGACAGMLSTMVSNIPCIFKLA